MIDTSALSTAPRLLVEAALAPVQGDRFQPTGFPDLGAATYTTAAGTSMLIVESHQSMANRLETVCWDEATHSLHPALSGLPYVLVEILEGKERTAWTASLLEAHRLNSPYILDGEGEGGENFESKLKKAAGYREGRPVDRAKVIQEFFRYDPNTLLHGVFMSNIGDGRIRLPRAISAVIEARDVQPVTSGGVKNDRVNASGDAKKGFGNVPFSRTEFTAGSMRLLFNLDLEQIRSYGLDEKATNLLILLALFKLQRLLSGGLRLRTACDLAPGGLQVTAPKGFVLPTLEALTAAIPDAIVACKASFAEPPVTNLRFVHTESSTKLSKKAAKAKAEEQEEQDEEAP